MAAADAHTGWDDAATPSIGDVVGGKYRVEGTLGEGGMGVVLAARHEGLGHEVAIKVLHPRMAGTGEAVARFLREARTVATLRSEHVARVIDVGSLPSGAPYMVMERLVGSDLGDALEQGGPLAVPDAVDYVLQACDALLEAHAAGVVHRDLKPSNLFLTRRPTGTPLVKVLDFGISKVEPTAGPAAKAGKLTSTGAVIGSPVYMSPEQIRSAKNVDARSDLWSLGVIVHELVSGRHPFEAESLSGILAAISADPPVPLREHRPDAPASLEALVLRCLEKEPARRVPDVATLAAELRQLGASPDRVTSVPGAAIVVAPASHVGGAHVHGGEDTLAEPSTKPAAARHGAGGAARGVAATTTASAPSQDARAETPASPSRPVLAIAAGVAVLVAAGAAALGLRTPGPTAPPSTSLTTASEPRASASASIAPTAPVPTVTPATTAVEPVVVAASAEPARSAAPHVAAERPEPAKPTSSARRPAGSPSPTGAAVAPPTPPPAPAPPAPTAEPKRRDPLLDRK